MLEKLDLEAKLSRKKYNKILAEQGIKLGEMQRRAREAKKPVIILFEGWRGVGRSRIINNIMQYMDARGFRVYSVVKLEAAERQQPFFSYFWKHLPAKGNIAIYHRSWYYLKTEGDIHFKGEEGKWLDTTYEHINNFEKVLTDDNYLLIKFFLHISPKCQKENLAHDHKTLGRVWKDIAPAFDESSQYQVFLNRYEKMLEATDTANAPWHLIAANNILAAEAEIFTELAAIMQRALDAGIPEAAAPARQELPYDVLSQVDLTKSVTKENYKEKLARYQKKLALLQMEMYKAGYPTVIGLEGWDAAGKGGAIRRLTAALDPLGYTVNPIASPNVVEKEYNHLWRFWVNLPAAGHIAIFDRTWYGRVLVERIEGFATAAEWQRAYDEIKDMEAQWAEHDYAIAKFWLHIDKDEQYRRFQERTDNPEKNWKITDEDWRNREKWDAYAEAVNEMLVRTDTSYAPWTVVEANDKYYARLKVLKTVIEMFEKKLGKKSK